MQPRGVRLFVDEQADLVAEVQLVSLGHAGDEPDHIESHRLDVQQVAPQQIGIVRQFETRSGQQLPVCDERRNIRRPLSRK